jgi:hypothetical protein
MLNKKLFLFGAVLLVSLVACSKRPFDVADCSDPSKVSDAHDRMLCENHKKMTEHRVPDELPKTTKGW